VGCQMRPRTRLSRRRSECSTSRRDTRTAESCQSRSAWAHSASELRVVTSIRDVAERERAEQALRKMEELFRVLVGPSPGPRGVRFDAL
jgi:hypothetical protein